MRAGRGGSVGRPARQRSAKAEYLRVDLGSFNCTGCTPAPAGNVSLQERRISGRRELSFRLEAMIVLAAAALSLQIDSNFRQTGNSSGNADDRALKPRY
jgi:hypothetical protein